MDVIDQSDEQNQVAFEAERRSKRKPNGPEANGFCNYCGEPVSEALRFCNKECCEDWEYLQSRK